MHRTSSRYTGTLCALIVLLAACGTTSKYQKPHRPKPTEKEQEELFRKAGQLFVQGGEEYDKAVAACCEDPIVAYWLTIRMIWHMKDAADRQRQRQAMNFQLRELETNERYTRARKTLGSMGEIAVPTIIAELVQNRYTDNRQLGATIFAAMRPDVVPRLEEAMTKSEPRYKRYYVEGVAGMKPVAQAEVLLVRWAKDEDYAIRAAAFVGLSRYGDRHLPALREAVAHDADSFVRRQIVKQLGRLKDRKTAAAVVEYYARCAADNDRRGITEAERTLIRMSGKPSAKGGRPVRYGLDHWRQWVLTLPVQQPERR